VLISGPLSSFSRRLPLKEPQLVPLGFLIRSTGVGSRRDYIGEVQLYSTSGDFSTTLTYKKPIRISKPQGNMPNYP